MVVRIQAFLFRDCHPMGTLGAFLSMSLPKNKFQNSPLLCCCFSLFALASSPFVLTCICGFAYAAHPALLTHCKISNLRAFNDTKSPAGTLLI
jgi:hypothetical protein